MPCRHCGKPIPPKALKVWWRHLCVGCRSYARRCALGPGREAYDYIHRVLRWTDYGGVVQSWQEDFFAE
ncbi:MAG: hypothetical protein ACYTG5_23405 [Planctomycetota bacterium]|jgi:hypothetical protein